MFEKVIVIDDVYNTDEIETLKNQLLQNANWKYSNVSTDSKDATKFFYGILKDNTLKEKFILDFILAANTQDHSLKLPKNPKRVYLNGQTYGLDGDFHTDCDLPNYHTLLYMVNSGDISDIGDFQYIDPSNNVVETVPFKSGRFVLFPSDWKHKGLAPTVKNKFRVTLAYKEVQFL